MPKEKVAIIGRLGYSFGYKPLKYHYFEGKEAIEADFSLWGTYFYVKAVEGRPPDKVIVVVDTFYEVEEKPWKAFLEEYERRRNEEAKKKKKIPASIPKFFEEFEGETEIKILPVRASLEKSPGKEDKSDLWILLIDLLKEEFLSGGSWKIYLDFSHGFRYLSDMLINALRYLKEVYPDEISAFEVVYQYWDLTTEECYSKVLVGTEKPMKTVEAIRNMLIYGIFREELLPSIEEIDEDLKKTIIQLYRNLIRCDVVGASKRLRSLAVLLERMPRGTPYDEIKKIVMGEFEEAFEAGPEDITILGARSILTYCNILKWYIEKGHFLHASISGMELTSYVPLALAATELLGESVNLKGRGRLFDMIYPLGKVMEVWGKQAFDKLITSYEGTLYSLISDEGLPSGEISVNRLLPEEKILEIGREVEKGLKKKRRLREKDREIYLKGKKNALKSPLPIYRYVVGKIRNFHAHAGIQWTIRHKKQKELEETIEGIKNGNVRISEGYLEFSRRNCPLEAYRNVVLEIIVKDFKKEVLSGLCDCCSSMYGTLY